MSTEFNSNINFGAIQKQSGVKHTDAKEELLEQSIDEDILSKSYDVPVGQNAIAGKSQIKTDNISNDLLTLKTNPRLVQLANIAFDSAYDQLVKDNESEAYEKAALIANAFVQECCGK